jgi:hypothetical protein
LAAPEGRRWRRQALTWLRADLAAFRHLLTRSPRAAPAVAGTLKRWQADPDLAGLRAGELKQLPAEERAACARLWADVAGLLRRAEREK